MVGWVELQHPVAHAAIDRLLKNRRSGAPSDSTDEVLAEAFVPQDCGDVGMAAHYMEAERRKVDWLSRAQSTIVGIRIGDKLGRPRIEQRRALWWLNLLVHDGHPIFEALSLCAAQCVPTRIKSLLRGGSRSTSRLLR